MYYTAPLYDNETQHLNCHMDEYHINGRNYF